MPVGAYWTFTNGLSSLAPAAPLGSLAEHLAGSFVIQDFTGTTNGILTSAGGLPIQGCQSVFHVECSFVPSVD